MEPGITLYLFKTLFLIGNFCIGMSTDRLPVSNENKEGICKTITFPNEKKLQKESIKLTLQKVQVDSETVTFCLRFSNLSDEAVVFYKPASEDFFNTILSVEIANVKNNAASNLVIIKILDLDSVTLSCTNSIVLEAGESFEKNVILKRSELAPKLEHGKYKMKVMLNYKDVNFYHSSCSKSIYKEDVSSQSVLVLVP